MRTADRVTASPPLPEHHPVRDAATVVVMRDVAGAAPELLMMERAATMAFAAGALVFPGGGVEEDDGLLARAIGGALDPVEATARIAGIRETIEESGIAIGFPAGFDPAPMRAAMTQGAPFSTLLERAGIVPDLGRLTPFARWQPDASRGGPRKRFDTRFYLAAAPEGQAASVDASETVHLFWSSAHETLRRHDAGEVQVIFPTRRNLERLAIASDLAAAQAYCARYPIEKIIPWREERADGTHLCIPSHLGYPVTSEPMRTVRRV